VERYANLRGDSAVVGYEIYSDSITVKFSDGWLYSYTYQSAGATNVEGMKQLAARGQGLNSFVNTKVKKRIPKNFVESDWRRV
jgi:hypothetical protein